MDAFIARSVVTFCLWFLLSCLCWPLLCAGILSGDLLGKPYKYKTNKRRRINRGMGSTNGPVFYCLKFQFIVWLYDKNEFVI
ncbi:TPA: hypothetical protein DCX62_02220 [Candidatus Azambacteria bacterium]|nr:MAG: hypothetical protein A3K28_00505 [Candidatus Azambacteria bacterium RIFOXYB1_FULL_40_33]OGD42151.1 MAG: hypothetical protein A3I82_00700 [Candidatus Azambacteria bacterium RIFCSPLOWO2_02_FULL_42_10]OGD42403.1 MAG: hypothetical protein A2193_00515 [Candidatus Azambacteria bacterium RIFOXYA1_FULL_42_37]HAJ44376.1 hypothetical protein [Candidatus Azambacteria bacterium]HAN61665.1 hypothetical protein [Candidatus Azambacteria bacterium]